MKRDKKINDFVKTTIDGFLSEQAEPMNDSDDNTDVVMKKLIIPVLDEGYELLEKDMPKTKPLKRSFPITDRFRWYDVEVVVKSGGIRHRSFFEESDIKQVGDSKCVAQLSWFDDLPTTKSENLNYRKENFVGKSINKLIRVLESNGYIRSGKLPVLKKTTAYDMYMAKDYDGLVKYYSSIFFKKS